MTDLKRKVDKIIIDEIRGCKFLYDKKDEHYLCPEMRERKFIIVADKIRWQMHGTRFNLVDGKYFLDMII